MCLQEAPDGRCDERCPAGDALEQDTPERIEVGSCVRDLAAYQLGREIGQRATKVTADLEGLSADRTAGPRQQAEIQEDGSAFVAHEHVRGLQIAMDDALAVNEPERLADPREESEDFCEPPPGRGRVRDSALKGLVQRGPGVRTPVGAPDTLPHNPVELFERPPGEELHCVPGIAVDDAVLEHLDDARVALALEKGDLLADGGKQARVGPRHGLDRNVAPRGLVHRPIDDPHRAPPEDSDDTVRTEAVGQRWRLGLGRAIRSPRQRREQMNECRVICLLWFTPWKTRTRLMPWRHPRRVRGNGRSD